MISPRSRIAIIVVAFGIALVSLSGCAALGVAVKTSEQSILNSDKPKAGSCWVSSYASSQHADWGDAPPVSCASAHQLYTYAVVPLADRHTGKLFDSNGYTRPGIYGDAINTCESAEVGILPEPPAGQPKRIHLVELLPDEGQWDVGARWVRCDVSVLAVGSRVNKPALANLPSIKALVSAMATDADQFRFCVNDPGGLGPEGPKGSNAVYADCRDNPEWRFKTYLVIPEPKSDEYPGLPFLYPGQAYLTSVYQQECQDMYSSPTKQTYAYYPSAASWLGSDTNEILACWVGIKQ